METTTKRGRPRKPPTEGKRSMLGLRVIPEVKDLLDNAAQRNSRTQSQEAELRIELSFRAEQQLAQGLELVYGRQLGGLLTLIGHALREAGRSAGFSATNTLDGAENWMLNAYAFDQAVEAANAILEAARPEGDTSPPTFTEASPLGLNLSEVYRNLGFGIAGPYLAATADPELAVSPDLKRIGAEAREKLGSAVVERIKRSVGAKR
jgi:hypothetical protein